MSRTTFKNNFAKIRAALDEGGRETVNQTLDAIADDAASLAPRDKGALATSIVALKDGEDHDVARAAAENRAQGKRPDVEFDSGLKLDDYSVEGIQIGAVEVPVSYATLIHNGFGSRSGRPFLEEAGNNQESEIEDRLARNVGKRLDRIK